MDKTFAREDECELIQYILQKDLEEKLRNKARIACIVDKTADISSLKNRAHSCNFGKLLNIFMDLKPKDNHRSFFQLYI